MEGQNILYGNIEDLRNVYAAVENQNKLRAEIEAKISKKNELAKDIEAEEKHLRENIENTVNKRREQVVSNFDKEMKKSQDRLKKTRNDRSKAKNKGVEERIKAETAELIQENKNLKDEIRTIFRQKGLWKGLDNKLVYVLYYPRTAKERVWFLLSAFIGLFVLPSVVVRVTHIFWLFEVLLYLLVLALVVAGYAFGYKYIKVDNRDAFMETKMQRASVLKNQEKIKRIIREIKKDKDDDRYNLVDYDEDIKELEAHIGDIVSRKNTALADFERTTKLDIEDEITKRDIEKINRLKTKQNEVNIELKEYEDRQKNLTLDISTNYTAYIGEENMTIERIEKMIVLLSEGKAKTIGDAVNILKNAQ